MTTTITIALSHVTCHKCAAIYGLNSKFVERAHENKVISWFCPHCGVSTIFATNKLEQLKKEKEQAESNAAWYRTRYNEQCAQVKHVESQRNGLRGALVKQSKRIKNGVCPCCSRSFINLQRHMKTQHPSFSGWKAAGKP